MTETLEQEARRLRDKLFVIPCSDKSWNDLKDHWMRDIAWLRSQVSRGLTIHNASSMSPKAAKPVPETPIVPPKPLPNCIEKLD